MVDWTHERYAAAAVTQIERMAGTVEGADFTTQVPTCPGWDLRQLVTHTGGVHRWAALMVGELATERFDRAALEAGFAGLADEELAGWLREGAGLLDEALTAHPGDAPMWAWGGDRHVRFWSRRQLHETVVHHADAALALGVTPDIPEEVAVDGVEEFLDILPYAGRWRPEVRELTGDGETISWRTGSGAAWLITLGPEGFTHERSAARASATLHADTAAELLLLIWRRGELERQRMDGETKLLRWWADHSMI
ncbi:maleylpyruvate isomerase family mycothiol-dependent enzyme [Nonomuraea dietziae]|uniref:maleylpyruvate isomerase family mycothiol-dependent enzyme n=1 Tax=Nonomuraea dietziae TaxID=65515 RepID=UPI0033DE5B4A